MSTIIHIPHSSAMIPERLRGQFCLSDQALEDEIILMTDSHTDDLFAPYFGASVQALVYGQSRLVVDPERYRDDKDEPMARRGMGAVYTQTAHGRVLRNLSALEREELLALYYDPHHQRLNQMTQKAVEADGSCLIIDAHSFPSTPLPCDLDQTPHRPDICLGTDPFHTPQVLLERAEALFVGAGFSVDVNRPYAGALVPLIRLGQDRRVKALMIEVNRRLYMEETTGARSATYGDLRSRLRSCLAGLCE